MSAPHLLFKLYESGNLPTENGFIITSSFDPNGSIYSTFEIISYANVKEIISDGNSITFRSDGYKIYILVEPSNYYKRATEPVFREEGKSVPYRFNELMIYTDYRNNRIMVGKQAIISLSSFSVDNPSGDNFSIYIHRDDQVESVMTNTLTKILNKELAIPTTEAKKASAFASDVIINAVKV